MERNATIKGLKVDVDLLREQRDAVISDIEHNLTLPGVDANNHVEALEGLTNMLDHMLDLAEGHRDESDDALVRDGNESDYVLTQDYSSCWVRVGNISVYIQRTDEGVAVDMWPHECEDMDLSPAGTWYTFQEATEEINCRKARDIGA